MGAIINHLKRYRTQSQCSAPCLSSCANWSKRPESAGILGIGKLGNRPILRGTARERPHHSLSREKPAARRSWRSTQRISKRRPRWIRCYHSRIVFHGPFEVLQSAPRGGVPRLPALATFYRLLFRNQAMHSPRCACR